jgi:signal transduction histidine kinase/ActR/RegA family two-component response regulator
MPGKGQQTSEEATTAWRLVEAVAQVAPEHVNLSVRRKARLLAVCLTSMTLLFVCADTAFLLTRPAYTPPWPGYLFLLGTYYLNRRGQYRIASALAIAMFPLVVFGQVLAGTSANTLSTLGFLTLSPLLGAILLTARGVGLLTFVNVLGIALLPSVRPQQLMYAESVGPLAAMAISGALAIAYMHHRDQIEADRQRQRQALEEQLRQAQKMEAVGRLAGGIAHDFNNLLTVILGSISLAKRQHRVPELDDAESACGSAANLTRQLLAFSRQATVKRGVVNLNDVLRTTSTMLRRIIGEDVDLQVVEGPDLANTLADVSQVQEILLNLASNARDAMPRGGKLVFRTENCRILEGEAELALSPGDYAVLEVTDEGEGMDERTKARIFEPFFTTKEVGRGTGLGMAMVFGIVQQSGGHIRVDSLLGRGTTFRFYFPKVDLPVVALEPPSSAVPGGAETILLVEDEQAVRNLCQRVLERAGYDVVVAQSPDEARALWHSAQRSFELLITDVVMPGEDGTTLASALQRSQPGLAVILMSGYAPTMAHETRESELPFDFLQKPFSPEGLLQKVRQTLDRRPARPGRPVPG